MDTKVLPRRDSLVGHQWWWGGAARSRSEIRAWPGVCKLGLHGGERPVVVEASCSSNPLIFGGLVVLSLHPAYVNWSATGLQFLVYRQCLCRGLNHVTSQRPVKLHGDRRQVWSFLEGFGLSSLRK